MRTIRAQFATGFALIMCSMLLLLNIVMSIFLRNNNDNVIAKELSSFRNHSNLYVRQAFLVNDLKSNAASFEKLSEGIAQALCVVTGGDVAVYNMDGQLINASDKERFFDTNYKDLENAKANILSFTIVSAGKEMDAFFSFPVVMGSERVGILRVRKSYLDLNRQTNDIRVLVLIASIVMFFSGYAFLTLLSNRISKPILALARATNQVARGQRVMLSPSTRRDEIGGLIDTYNAMIRRIERQIRIIERDRDDLERLNSHRKDFYDQLTHELKTPLTTIMGYSEVLRRNGFTDKAFFDMGIDYIIEESKRLEDMVQNLLEYSKGVSRVSEKPARVNLSEICVRTAEEMQIKAGRYSSECIALVEPDIHVIGVAEALKRMVLNLIDNAIKYGDRGELIHVRLSHADGKACLSVANRGRTLSEEEIRKLFIPFYQSNPSQVTEAGSAGLGLYIVRNIVDEHHGDVSITSRDGLTTVRVCLDLDEGRQSHEA
jgi:signal transduction histidine kinase